MSRNLIIRDGKPQKPLMVVTTILDESGSMQCLKNTAIKGYNQYLEDCKDISKDNIIHFGLLKFNSNTGIKVVHDHALLSKVKKMIKGDYDPNGGTPLYDAIWKGMDFTEKFVGEKKANVLFIIITDGQENSSIDHKLPEVKDRINEKEKVGWSFRFVGVEYLAEVQASDLGIGAIRTIIYQPDRQGMNNMYNTVGNITRCWSNNNTGKWN